MKTPCPAAAAPTLCALPPCPAPAVVPSGRSCRGSSPSCCPAHIAGHSFSPSHCAWRAAAFGAGRREAVQESRGPDDALGVSPCQSRWSDRMPFPLAAEPELGGRGTHTPAQLWLHSLPPGSSSRPAVLTVLGMGLLVLTFHQEMGHSWAALSWLIPAPQSSAACLCPP